MDFKNLPFKFDHYYYVEVDGTGQNARVYNQNYEDVALTAQQSKKVAACFVWAITSGLVSMNTGIFFARPNQNGEIKVTWSNYP